MKAAEVILADHVMNIRLSEDSEIEEIVLREWAVACMKQYAVEALNELVDEMLAYPPNELSESANLIQIANKIKREIHGVVGTKPTDKANEL
jgi:hypothetical protein